MPRPKSKTIPPNRFIQTNDYMRKELKDEYDRYDFNIKLFILVIGFHIGAIYETPDSISLCFTLPCAGIIYYMGLFWFQIMYIKLLPKNIQTNPLSAYLIMIALILYDIDVFYTLYETYIIYEMRYPLSSVIMLAILLTQLFNIYTRLHFIKNDIFKR